MDIVEVSAEEYQSIVGKNTPVFNRKDFLELNRNKADKIHYLIGKDTKNRIAFAIGEIKGEWRAPFSAPFSNIILLKKDLSVEYIWEFAGKLVEYAKNCGGKLINIYMPADIYGMNDNSRILNALLGNGFKIKFQDVNYSFDLCSFDMESYESLLHYNARKNLKISMNSGLEFVKCETHDEKAQAYEIIRINRTNRGFPLRMTKEEVLKTAEVVEHDFFLIKKDGSTIASAVVYRLTGSAAQVVYWGDIADVGEYKPINFLSYNLIKYYKELSFEILDIGISTEEGIPNYGLCAFKESLGCVASSKFRLEILL